MAIGEKETRFGNKAIVDWEPGTPIGDPVKEAYRLQVDYEDQFSWVEKLARFAEDPRAPEVTAVVVGPWDVDMFANEHGPDAMISALVAARARLKKLTALFIGDITFEESEMSWIVQGNLAPLFLAYPKLHHFRARSGRGLELGHIALAHLRSLVIETGGMTGQVVRDVLAADLPALEHLELWLGTEEYGRTATVEDLAPLLRGECFPKLKYLGLRNCDEADDLAEQLATAPILERITTLDLSLGTLSDTGAAALFNCPAVRKLKKLDIHHHYCSAEMVASLHDLGIQINARDPQSADEDDGHEYRYVSVGE